MRTSRVVQEWTPCGRGTARGVTRNERGGRGTDRHVLPSEGIRHAEPVHRLHERRRCARRGRPAARGRHSRRAHQRPRRAHGRRSPRRARGRLRGPGRRGRRVRRRRALQRRGDGQLRLRARSVAAASATPTATRSSPTPAACAASTSRRTASSSSGSPRPASTARPCRPRSRRCTTGARWCSCRPTEPGEMYPMVETTVKRRGIRIEPGAKRVRVYLGGQVVADTTRPMLVWEVPYYPAYYLPRPMCGRSCWRPTGTPSTRRAAATAGPSPCAPAARRAARAHGSYADSPIEELRDLIRFDWHAMDAWFEEDEEVFTHPRNPYTRVDILASSRHVRVEVDGATIAESTSPRMLFETGLPVRYYLPKTHVRMDLLAPTETVSHCPYKGPAEYWSVRARRRRPRRPRLVVPRAVRREPEGRRADRVLQREGRHLRRRRAPGASGHQVLVTNAGGRRLRLMPSFENLVVVVARRVPRAARARASSRACGCRRSCSRSSRGS